MIQTSFIKEILEKSPYLKQILLKSWIAGKHTLIRLTYCGIVAYLYLSVKFVNVSQICKPM